MTPAGESSKGELDPDTPTRERALKHCCASQHGSFTSLPKGRRLGPQIITSRTELAVAPGGGVEGTTRRKLFGPTIPAQVGNAASPVPLPRECLHPSLKSDHA
jgi:hypothetical protein